jgi:hypothetical protein
MDGGVIKIHDRHPLFASLGRGWSPGCGGHLGAHRKSEEKTK